jgi:hypothetical protein
MSSDPQILEWYQSVIIYNQRCHCRVSVSGWREVNRMVQIILLVVVQAREDLWVLQAKQDLVWESERNVNSCRVNACKASFKRVVNFAWFTLLVVAEKFKQKWKRVLEDKDPYLTAAFIVASFTLLYELWLYCEGSLRQDWAIKCGISWDCMVLLIYCSTVRVIFFQWAAKRAIFESTFHWLPQLTLVNSHNILSLV